MKPPSLSLLAFSLVTLSSLPGQAAVQVTGSLSAIEHTQYAGIASQFLIEDAEADGTPIYDGQVYIFCSDLAARSLDEDLLSYPHSITPANSNLQLGGLESFDVWDRYSTAQNEAMALAQIHWLLDNYYESHFISPPGDSENLRQYALQNVIWEIFGDGGTALGLSFSDGNIQRTKFQTSAPGLWNEMNAMLDAVEGAGITESYVSTFTVLGVLDDRAGYQDYIALAANPQLMTVPEPTALPLMVAGLSFLGWRRRR